MFFFMERKMLKFKTFRKNVIMMCRSRTLIII